MVPVTLSCATVNNWHHVVPCQAVCVCLSFYLFSCLMTQFFMCCISLKVYVFSCSFYVPVSDAVLVFSKSVSLGNCLQTGACFKSFCLVHCLSGLSLVVCVVPFSFRCMPVPCCRSSLWCALVSVSLVTIFWPMLSICSSGLSEHPTREAWDAIC